MDLDLNLNLNMDILFISHKFPPVIGGMEKHAFELVNRLESHFKVHRLVYDNQEGRFWFFYYLKKRVRAILKANPNIQLVYANDGLLATQLAWLKKEQQVKVVATVHGLDIVHPNGFYQQVIRRNLSQLDHLIAVSRATKAACVQRGILSEKVSVVKNGVDHDLAQTPFRSDFLSQFAAKRKLPLIGKKILVTMGRPVKRKGFSWFVKEVVPRLPDNTVLLMIGPRKNKWPSFWNYLPSPIRIQIELATGMANDESALSSSLQHASIKGKVFELGKLPFSEVLQLLAAADLFIMPNIQVMGDMEGFGLVALEAALCGTPVLAADIEGIRDAVQDGQNGYLLPSRDDTAWVDKIHSLLSQPISLRQLGQQARDFTLANYSWEQMAFEYQEIFDTFRGDKQPEFEGLLEVG